MFGKLAKGFDEALKKVDVKQVESFLDQAAPHLQKVVGGGVQVEGRSTKELPVETNSYQLGKAKALLIGINYFGQNGELRGCLNDVKNVKAYLSQNSQFKEYKVITDDPESAIKPTRQNMIDAMKWLVQDAQPGDSFFFHYSGHGSHVADNNGDESDGRDECLCPLDYAQNDDELHEILVKPLPKGASLVAILDCCHSGSGMDLPFTYSVDGKNQITLNNKVLALNAGIDAAKALLRKDGQRAIEEAMKAVKLYNSPSGNTEQKERTVKEKSSPADILMFSGCMDTQTSADAHIEGNMTGAMSWALLKVLNENKQLTMTQLLQKLREALHGKYQQIPQMSTGHEINVVDTPFKLHH